MNINWKWILGIASGLLVLALVGYGFFMLGQHVGADLIPDGFAGRGFGGRMPMHGFGSRGFDSGFMQRGFGMAPFGLGFMLFGGLFRLLIPLALLGLVVWFSYSQGKKAGMNIPAPAEPAEPKA